MNGWKWRRLGLALARLLPRDKRRVFFHAWTVAWDAAGEPARSFLWHLRNPATVVRMRRDLALYRRTGQIRKIL